MGGPTRAPESFPPDEDLLASAVDAARLGGEVLLRHLARSGDLAVSTKGAKDWVTRADREAESAIVDFLRRRHPDSAFRAEESPATPGSGPEWIIDPLDGTTNFIHSYPFFATSVAVRAGGEVRAGAVHDPVRDELFAARKGAGATLNGSAIRVSTVTDLKDALLVTGFPFRTIDVLPQFLRSLERLIRISAGVRRDGSAALDCCYVACGRLDGFWEYGLSAWDIAAGCLLVEEAGGRVTDFEGARGFLDSGNLVASPKPIHPAFLHEVQSAFR
jgi:myo-inositol-1(or 4)-monophosphatase